MRSWTRRLRSGGWVVGLPLVFIGFVVGTAVYRGCGCRDDIAQTYPSPNGNLKVILSTADCGATAHSDMDLSLVATNAVGPGGGCRLLTWDPRDFLGEPDPIVDVRWVDDSRIELTYPARLNVRAVTHCPGVDVVHFRNTTETKLRGYVCLDTGAETFQLCDQDRRDRWVLLRADKAKGWMAVRADAHPVAPPNVPTPYCRSERVYVEMNGIVRPLRGAAGPDDARAPGWEITATEFTYEAPIPRGGCAQFWDGAPH